jgi:hypothetical protein
MARAFYYQTLRGPVADFIKVRFDRRLQAAMTSPGILSDDQEIMRQFTEDLFKYEYLLLLKEPAV